MKIVHSSQRLRALIGNADFIIKFHYKQFYVDQERTKSNFIVLQNFNHQQSIQSILETNKYAFKKYSFHYFDYSMVDHYCCKDSPIQLHSNPRVGFLSDIFQHIYISIYVLMTKDHQSCKHEKLVNQLIKKLDREINQLIQATSTLLKYKTEIKICKYFFLLLRITHPYMTNNKQITQKFYGYFVKISNFSSITKQLKGKRLLPIFGKICNYFEKMYGQKVVQLSTKAKTQPKQWLSKYLFKCQLFDKKQKDKQAELAKIQQLNRRILQISRGELILPDPDCICCSKVLIKNQEISHCNPCIPNLIGLTQKQSLEQIQLYKNLCSLCNLGGGVLLLGTEKQQNSLRAAGIIFKDQKMLTQIKTKISTIIKKYIRPVPHEFIQQILVHTNFTDKKQVKLQKFRYCLRITIVPQQVKQLNFIQISVNGYQNTYQSYVRGQNNDLINIIETKQKQKTNFYTYAHEVYKKKLKSIPAPNIHYTKCQVPQFEPSIVYSQIPVQQQQNVELETLKMTPEEQIHQLKFDYQYNSLLIVGSKMKDRHIKELRAYMENKKNLFTLSRPYENQFKSGARSVWMLSHYDKHDIIKGMVKQCNNSGAITFIPVHKALQIEESKLTQNIVNQLKQKFANKFKTTVNSSKQEKTTETGKKKQIVVFSFDDLSQAIFAYLIFESFQLKPYFSKQGEYKTKI